MPQGTLEVDLIRAHDLKDVETFGKSDPYALLSCGNVAHRSHTVLDGGSNPVWNQTFKFEIPDGISDLSVAIYDQENHGHDKIMGTVLIHLADVFSQREIPLTKYKVRLPGGRLRGEAELQLRFFPKIYRGYLELHLINGHGLISADVFDKSDPYAVITCNKQSLKSKVKEDAGSDPVWNETFAFTVDSEVHEAQIYLFDRDTFTADDPLGSAMIPLQAVFTERHVPSTSYKVFGKSGEPQGEVEVELKFVEES